MTAKADDGIRTRLLRQGVQDYLLKPFSVDELRVRVDNLIAAKQGQRELRISEARLREMVAISADAIISLDADQRITLFNSGAEKIFGYAANEVLGTELERLLPQRFRAVHRRHIERFMASGDTARRVSGRSDAIIGLRKNGEEFPADAAISQVMIAGYKTLNVSLRDITQQKRIEKQQRFLARAGLVLASTLDFKDTLDSIVQLAVEELADLCMVEVIDESGAISRLIHTRDPAYDAISEILRNVRTDGTQPRVTSHTLATWEPLLIQSITPEFLQSVSVSALHLRTLRALNPQSALVMPLIAGGQLLGAILLASVNPSYRYTSADIPLAEELARRAAMAIQNARMYRDARARTLNQ